MGKKTAGKITSLTFSQASQGFLNFPSLVEKFLYWEMVVLTTATEQFLFLPRMVFSKPPLTFHKTLPFPLPWHPTQQAAAHTFHKRMNHFPFPSSFSGMLSRKAVVYQVLSKSAG